MSDEITFTARPAATATTPTSPHQGEAMTDLAAIANQLRSIADQLDPPPPPVTRHRDAITGQYVTADEADNRPDTTIRETRKP